MVGRRQKERTSGGGEHAALAHSRRQESAAWFHLDVLGVVW